MQVTETRSEGLTREYTVVLPATELDERLTSELTGLKDKVRINGFRPGKVPVQHLRRVYGRSVMADLLQTLVNEANRKIIDDNELKLAFEPQVVLPEDKDQVEAAIAAKGDFSYTVKLEVLPKFDLADFSGLKVTREMADVDEKQVDEAVERMATQNRAFTDKDGKAAKGDRVTIDFVGSIDGTPFEGGTGTDVAVEIGSNTFIPGFEDQLVGLKAGAKKVIEATFPEDYRATHLAGKPASFDVTVKGIAAPGEIKIDDDLAKGFGLESLDKLKEAVRGSLEGELAQVSRRKLKRELLDALDGQYTFELPPTLLDQEFQQIWRQVEMDMQQSGKTFADDNTTEEEARAEYRKIAERRVRLGLVLAEIGEQAKVQVSDDEVTQALVERARQFPGQERQVWEFYRQNPQAIAEVRAPIFEDKVIDHILSTASVTEKKVSREELLKEDEEDAPEAGETAAKPKKGKKKASA